MVGELDTHNQAAPSDRDALGDKFDQLLWLSLVYHLDLLEASGNNVANGNVFVCKLAFGWKWLSGVA